MKYTFKDGTVKEGNFIDNQLEGTGFYTDTNHNKKMCMYSKGKLVKDSL